MSKHKFQVGDLAFWRSVKEDDIGLVIGFHNLSGRVRILWLKSEDGLGYYQGESHYLYTQQEWDARNEQR